MLNLTLTIQTTPMKYELPTKLAGYYPEVLSILSSIEDSSLFHEDKNLSHPADIFLLAFNDVIECAHRLSKRVNAEVGRIKSFESVGSDALDDLRIDIFNLIFYTSNFIEACQSIIKSLFMEGGKSKEFAKAVREFGENTKPYRDHTSKIINEIKHQHRRIRPFTYAGNNNLIIGYFVEGLVQPNTIGPEPKIHEKYNGVNTGISVNRDIPYHLVNIFFASACLASVIRKYAKINTIAPLNLPGEQVVSCLGDVAKIRLMLLPDEFYKQIPSVFEHKANHFTLELPSNRKPENMAPYVANISVTARIGIRNRSIAPPYFMPTKTD